MFENGSSVIKVDFHMHTRKDKEFSYTGIENDFVKTYISKMAAEGISVGIITNHNKFDRDEYVALRNEGRKKDILILPGVELAIKEGANGVHTLIIFDPDAWLSNGENQIESFLNVVFKDIHNRENENTRCKKDLLDTIRELNSYNRGYFIVFAHVEQSSGFLKECNGGLIQSLSSDPIFRDSVLGFQKVRTRRNIPVFEQQLGYKVAFLEGSDCKSIEDIGKDRSYCYVKIGAPSYGALKFALQAFEDRVYTEEPTCNYSHIESVSFEGGLLDGTTIGLSPDLNTFIGIRGSGKSAVIEIIRYALTLSATVDDEYKEDLVKYVLGSGGVVSLSVKDEHGNRYTIRRILGENAHVIDADGSVMGIDSSAVIRNPVYFGQKDLALTKPGYEFELLHKLLGNANTESDTLDACIGTIKTKLSDWFELEGLPQQIEDLSGRLRELEHKIKVFEERGVASKLAKQTSFSADLLEIKSVLANCRETTNQLTNAITNYEGTVFITQGYTSNYNIELFEKIRMHITAIHEQYAKIIAASSQIADEIDAIQEIQGTLTDIIEELKEEFAEIRRELSDTQLDIEAFGKYKEGIDQITRDIASKKNKLNQVEVLRRELIELIAQRTEILRERFALYKAEIDRVNSSQTELALSIEFKGDKKVFLQQLKDQFKGSGITETKYGEIAKAFSDFIAIVEDVLFEDGKVLRTIITANQYLSLVEKIKQNYAEYIVLTTPDKVEIKYHGKILSRHSTGQRASALALFILAQKDNDIIIIDQPEDDLDNQVIYTEFIKRVKEKKTSTQFIFATHNANIPVLGDAERIVAAQFSDMKMEMECGTIDTTETHKQIVTIMEGGHEAFQRRNAIYGSWK